MNPLLRYALTVAAILGVLALIVLSRLPAQQAPASEPRSALDRPSIVTLQAERRNRPG